MNAPESQHHFVYSCSERVLVLGTEGFSEGSVILCLYHECNENRMSDKIAPLALPCMVALRVSSTAEVQVRAHGSAPCIAGGKCVCVCVLSSNLFWAFFSLSLKLELSAHY